MKNGGLTHRTKCGDAIRNELFEIATDISRKTGKPRSRIFDDALEEYIKNHYPEYIKKGSE